MASYTTTKANCTIEIIKRLSQTSPLKPYKNIGTSTIIIWKCRLRPLTVQIFKEQLQDYIVPSIRHLSYEQRLLTPDLPPLKYRHLCGDMINVYRQNL